MKPRINPVVVFGVLSMLVWAMGTAGQETETPSSKKDDSGLEYSAGSTVGRQLEDGSLVKIFSDSVVARHLDAFLKALEGRLESGPGLIRFSGGAMFRDSLRTLNADTLVYYEKTQFALAIGRVLISQGMRTVTADTVLYRKAEKIIEARGNVTIRDDSTRSYIRGEAAVFNDSTNIGYIVGNPYLERIDDEGVLMTVTASDTLELLEDEGIVRLWRNITATRDSLVLTCSDTLEIYHKDNLVRLWSDVTAVQDSLTTRSKHAVFTSSDETLVLTGEPEIVYQSAGEREEALTALLTTSTVNGDSVVVFFRDQRVSGAEILGSALSVTVSEDSAGTIFDRSIIESRVMRLTMDGGVISQINAEGTAQSYYYRTATDTGDMFVNNASGDTLTFIFDNGKIDEMKIFGFGGGLGKGMYYGYDEIRQTVADSTAVSPR